MSERIASIARPAPQPVLRAMGLAAIVVGVEYLARRIVLVWFPTIGSLQVNDMLSAGVAYSALVWLTIPPAKRNPAAIGSTLRATAGNLRRVAVWAAAGLAIAASMLIVVDTLLWGAIRLPALESPWRWEATLFANAAPLLVVVSLLLVNGILIPLAEEWLWRGLIQPHLSAGLGAIAGLLITSVLFSLKHAIVDASLGRLLTLSVFGLVMGVLAQRQGWRASAAAHAIANTSATSLALSVSGGQP